MGFDLFFTSIWLGVGLAMDAFAVSLANGFNEPKMKKGRICLIAGTFGIFQAAMPMIGWLCVHTFITYFEKFSKFIPWIAFALLLYIGGKMLIEGIKNKESEDEVKKLGFGALMVQGIATSIDALSVGFTIADYSVWKALVSAGIIAAVTFGICVAGVNIGKKFGTKLANKASIFGGIILIAIGLKILIESFI